MKIGILVTSIGNFGKKEFYNTQEIGLAKALDKLFPEVRVYKYVSIDQKVYEEKIPNCKNTTIQYIPAKSIGINGIVDTTKLDATLDVLIYFADTQLAVPKIYKWAKKNHIQFYPYIGVLKSHSTSQIKKVFVNLLAERNYLIFRKCTCLAKTPNVKKELLSIGAKNVIVAPVGLDISVLNQEYKCYEKEDLKKKYGYSASDKVMLFIGRFTNEKQPLKVLKIFEKTLQEDSSYKLLMVGSGELSGEVENDISRRNVNSAVKIIEKIPNKDIWELYRLADVFVNLNQQEIFGMAILEAMYYGCKVVAWKAPGPEYIIENDINGFIVRNDSQMIEAILHKSLDEEASQKRIMDFFTWEATAKLIAKLTC